MLHYQLWLGYEGEVWWVGFESMLRFLIKIKGDIDQKRPFYSKIVYKSKQKPKKRIRKNSSSYCPIHGV